ncbi:4'-phosphopantetheine phosphatase [Cylas formicarius]|uniref:4'-phosphopantetheine phosphatase n=1 Tax=Cylas formicarius TaxID=197179 RepID=UPI0029583F12|nr:4'-phosphopantetheine phosphatase [Cylas formicarius]XP_060516885.1 4'-phosphopantetheine phosphatase [Cylas formicarius]
MAKDIWEKKNQICPLLKEPEVYNPDTIDLLDNENARNYWLPCLEAMVERFTNKAGSLNPDNPEASEIAKICYQEFQDLLAKIKSDPLALKPLSIRTLLEFNEDNLRSHNLKDAWHMQKESESLQAFQEFNDRLIDIDSINDFEEKWQELIKGALAGNVFDWGSFAVSSLLETSTRFGFGEAMKTIERRPWFHDNFDVWITHLNRQPYKCVVIFVDNAGVDFVLGVLPLVREFLSLGSKVILAGNSSPSLNDVTYSELNVYCCKAAEYCNVIKNAISTGKLVTVENGQHGPCLDLTSLSPELCNLIKASDLVILEGMARAIHTNLDAKFTVDSIKMAVLKNEWLAKSLGATQFAVIFRYEPAA